MSGLLLKLNGKNVVLDEKSEISIERTSPVFNESGTFSYPFSIPYEPNREALGVLDLPDADVNLHAMKLPFELYYDGMLILSGIATSDSDEITDTVELELGSGQKVLLDALGELNMRSLKRISKVPMATAKYSQGVPGTALYDQNRIYNKTHDYSEGYDSCCVDVITSGVVEENTNSQRTGLRGVSQTQTVRARITDPEQSGHRTNAPMCVFLKYAVDAIISHADYTVTRDDTVKFPLFNRLAMLNTRMEYDKVHVPGNPDTDQYFLSSKNLPDVSCSEFINSLTAAFGMKLISDEIHGFASILLLRNVLLNIDQNGYRCGVLSLDGSVVYVNKKHVSPQYVRVTYDNSSDDTAYYCPLSADIAYLDSFGNLPKITYSDGNRPSGSDSDTGSGRPGGSGNRLSTRATTESSTGYTPPVPASKSYKPSNKDTTTYIVKNTGTRFRVKVNDEGENPCYFEVDQFRDYIPEGWNEEQGTELKIGFKPVINNMVSTALAENSQTVHCSDRPVFIDCEGTEEAVRDYDCGFQLGFLQQDEKAMMRDDVIGEFTPAFTADTMDVWGEPYAPAYENNFSLRLDADNSSDRIGVDASLFPDVIATAQPRRGLVDNFLSEYIRFMADRKKIVVRAQISLSDLVSIDWTRRYRVGDYTGLIDRISYDIGSDGVGVSELEMYLI